MKRTPISVTDVRFADPGNSAVHMMVHFEELRELGPLPFLAHPNDVHDHGKQLYARALSGEFGPIAPCTISAEEHVANIKRHLCAHVDRKMDAAHGSMHPDFRSPIYSHKVDEARRAPAFDAKAEDFPLLAACIPHDGDTIEAVAKAILARDAAWRKHAATIESTRASAKAAIQRAPNEHRAREALGAIKV